MVLEIGHTCKHQETIKRAGKLESLECLFWF